jgi:hypothetical protein
LKIFQEKGGIKVNKINSPLTLPSSLDGKGRKDNGKILTVPFTFILSRMKRENLREFI